MSDAPSRSQSQAELGVKLVIAVADYATLVYFAYLHVVTEATVPHWLFVLLVAILGAMLGQDIIRDRYRN